MIEQFENKIINADCLDILKQLPDKCIDLVLTDPPYGIGIDGQKQCECKNPKHNRKEHQREKEFDYWKASCKRLEDHQRQGVLF